jgi:hypothetical protein
MFEGSEKNGQNQRSAKLFHQLNCGMSREENSSQVRAKDLQREFSYFP